jgi:HEPN domain-containing protein
MVDKGIVNEWIEKAVDDYEFARINLEEGKRFFAQICFHFHQAGEKYLKAYIVANELEFRKIHDLSMLLRLCIEKDPSFKQIRDECEFLNGFYMDTRYPVQWPAKFSAEEAQKAHQASLQIRSFVEGKLGERS